MTDIHRTTPRFLCVGDIDVDILARVEHLPARDSKVNGELLLRAPGGMASNVALALSKLGASVRILGRVGDDEEATFALVGLSNAGVDTSFVSRLTGVRTFSCIGLITPDGEKSLIKLMTAAYRPSAEDLTEEACEGVTHIHLTSVGDRTLCRRVAELGQRHRATVSADLESADFPPDVTDLESTLSDFDILFCNSQSRSLLDARLSVPTTFRKSAIITTLADLGARAEFDGREVVATGFRADVVDTTGAGDCFAAACLYARMIQQLDWPGALRFANRAAALSTEGLGAQSALPDLSAVRSGLQS